MARTPLMLRTVPDRVAKLARRLPRAQPGAPRLVLRFAIYAAVALAVASAGMFFFVRARATDRAESAASFHARFIADTILRDQLHPADFAIPASGERLRQLDRLFSREVLTNGALRVKLYGANGVVTYSNDHSLLATTPEDDEVVEALDGEATSHKTKLNAEGGSGSNGKALEFYVPVRLGRSTRPQGVFELYQDYAPVAHEAQETFLPVAGVSALALLALYVSFLPILRRVARRLSRHAEEIEYQALHDELTGLPNRTLLHDRLGQALLAAKRRGEGVAVLMLDLDRFKEINDTLGHQSGDLVLKEVGRRLEEVLRESDTVARLGGDEFAVLAPGAITTTPGLSLAERITDALEAPIVLGELPLEVEASIGIAAYPAHGDDAETLLRRADVAMYLSKETHAPAVYDSDRDHYSSSRLALVGDLRRAISGRELIVHYQPLADMRSAHVHTVEALVRWEHPERGLLPPNEFIPLAQHTGLIRPLTRYVLESALVQLRLWDRDGLSLRVSVNVSARDLLDLRLPDEVAELTQGLGVDPSRLQLEITEDTILTDPRRAALVLARLSEQGVMLAIDDFGTGYSSLGYLKQLPVDVLKIDKSFVLKMGEDGEDAAIVRSTIELGHNLGLEVVGEGVETGEMWTRLAELGCDTAQGFYLSRPTTPESLGTVLAKRPVGAAA
jgi:diguanylate cyclase (GGDEF)-like protein